MHRVCVFTGTRAEYGLLSWTMHRIQDDADLQLLVLVSGAHLSERLGATYRQIESDGFSIDAKVEMELDDDSALGLARSTGHAMADLAQALSDLSPDVLVVLGDRYEAFAVATAAMMLRIPIAHIHGGEVTEGAIDDALRHSITHMSWLHFPAAEPYRQRILQFGVPPERVFNVGAPGLEAIRHMALLDRDALSAALDFSLVGSAPLFVITYHPVTLAEDDPASGVRALLSALENFPDARIIFTKANADTHGQQINEALESYSARYPGRVYLTASLGAQRYFSAVSLADVVIGNSSSGLIEAPVLGTPTVNIGDRQKGRLSAPSVIDCAPTVPAIIDAIKRAMNDDVQAVASRKESPYGQGKSSEDIVFHLKAALACR